MNVNHDLDYDLLIYIANWPASRINAWTTLLKARAIENLCYVVGVNRTGTDGGGVVYNGHSKAIDYKGKQTSGCENEEEIKVISLNLEELTNYRRKFPAHNDSDPFKIINL